VNQISCRSAGTEWERKAGRRDRGVGGTASGGARRKQISAFWGWQVIKASQM